MIWPPVLEILVKKACQAHWIGDLELDKKSQWNWSLQQTLEDETEHFINDEFIQLVDLVSNWLDEVIFAFLSFKFLESKNLLWLHVEF